MKLSKDMLHDFAPGERHRDFVAQLWRIFAERGRIQVR
jgi:hypothetical protein